MAQERAEKCRRAFRRLTDQLDPNYWVFVDEMGSHLALTRLYARAAPGERVPDPIPADRQGNLSTIGALGMTGLRSALSGPGAIDGETMIFFVEEWCVGSFSAHVLARFQSDRKNCWSKVKSLLRSLKPRTLDDLLEALTKAFAAVTKQDILGWFRHCGYRVART